MGESQKNLLKLKWYEFIVAFLLILCSQLFYSSNIMPMFGILFMAYAFFAKEEKVMLLLMLLIPSAENLKFYGSTTIPIAMVLAYFLKFILLKFAHRVIKKPGWLLCSFILLFYCMCTYRFVGVTEPILTTLKCLLFLIFMCGVFEKYRKLNLNYSDIYVKLLEYLGIGLICASSIEILINGGIELSRFSFGSGSTINVIGIQCAIVIIGLIYSHVINISKNNKDLPIIILCMLIVMLTMSKTAILMIIVGVVMLTIFGFIRGKNFKSMIIFIFLLFIILGTYSFSTTVHNYVDKILLRFQAEDLSNGRYSLWEQTIAAMKNDKKYFFVGAGDYKKIGATYGKNHSVLPAHNFLVESWVIYGTIGVIIVAIQFLMFIKYVIPFSKYNNLFRYDNWVSFVPIIVVIAGFFYSHHFIGRPNSILFIISFIPIILQRENLIRLNDKSQQTQKIN